MWVGGLQHTGTAPVSCTEGLRFNPGTPSWKEKNEGDMKDLLEMPVRHWQRVDNTDLNKTSVWHYKASSGAGACQFG